MTTYILHGGMTSQEVPEKNKFYAQFTALTDKQEVKIIMCYWARERSIWESRFEGDKEKVLKNTNKVVKFYVPETSEDLAHLLSEHDVLYVAGGEAEFLEPLYEKFSRLSEKLEGKVYIGSSMGAFLVSESYVLSLARQAENEVHKGVGLLPIQTLCHWNVEEKKLHKLKLLREHSSSPIITLNEKEFITIYK